jgi:NAD(P)H-nitrite reductase large subunit
MNDNKINAKYLIIGNGAAAINAASAIRDNDPSGSIVLVAKEPQHTYSRPLISYRLAGKVTDAGMDYRKRDFYQVSKVQTILGVEVTRLDTASRLAYCSDGTTIQFEKLLLAIGGAPIKPPIPGLDAGGVFTFTTWDDEIAIDKYIQKTGTPRGAVVLGGGLIGLKSVEAMVHRNVPVTVVELADRVLAVTFDKEASSLAEKSLADKGVTIRTNNTVKQILSERGVIRSVILNDGEKIDCDLLILAIGVRPDVTLLAGTDIKTDRGIVVDSSMATNIAGIYAAGDVAQADDALTGKSRPIPILPAAARQGKIAGTNMAGGKATYEGGIPMNAVDVVGLPTISVGQTVEQAGDEVLKRTDAKTGAYRKIVLRDGRVIGAIFIGQIERAGIFTGLIRSKLDVSAFKDLLLSDEFGLLSLPTDYRAHMVRGAGIEV